jgi:hypothetical protein
MLRSSPKILYAFLITTVTGVTRKDSCKDAVFDKTCVTNLGIENRCILAVHFLDFFFLFRHEPQSLLLFVTVVKCLYYVTHCVWSILRHEDPKSVIARVLSTRNEWNDITLHYASVQTRKSLSDSVYLSKLALGPTHPPIQWVLGVLTPGVWSDHSPPSSAEVKYAWIYISTPPYVFMAWYLVKHRDNFTVTTFSLVMLITWDWAQWCNPDWRYSWFSSSLFPNSINK